MKSSLISFFILSFIYLFYLTSSKSQCTLKQNIVNKQILNKETVACMQKALRYNWNDVIEYLTKQKQNEYQQEFINIMQNQIKRLYILEQQIVLGTSQTQPTLKWGQNKTHIFLTFKLSHRWDSPPCLYTQTQSASLNQNHLNYINVCLVSHQKVSFKINLTLFKNVVYQINDAIKVDQNFTEYKFEVKKDGVGTYSIILLKQIPEIWLFLTNQQKIYSNWYEIQTRYPQDYSEYSRQVQQYRQIKKKMNQSLPSSQSSLLFKKIILLILMILIIL